jgi:hypothetical protein
MRPAVIVALYVAGAVVLLAFIKLLYSFTLSDNMTVQQSQEAVIDGHNRPSVAVSYHASSRIKARGDPATLLRCLVLYSQWMLLVASVNIDWPDSIAYPVRVLAWVWSSANPETLSVNCLLSGGGNVPVSAQRVLFYLTMPLVMLLVLLLLELLLPAVVARVMHRRTAARLSVKDRLASIAMIDSVVLLLAKRAQDCFWPVCVHSPRPASCTPLLC